MTGNNNDYYYRQQLETQLSFLEQERQKLQKLQQPLENKKQEELVLLTNQFLRQSGVGIGSNSLFSNKQF